jgi:diguanylate cyclase (GGDEF)-like protein
VNSPDPTPLKAAPRAIRNRLALSVGTLVVAAIALTVGGFAYQRSTITGISDQIARADEVTDLEDDLRSALIDQRTAATGSADGDPDEAMEAFEEAVERELVVYLALARIAANDDEIQEATNDVRQAATEWREEWAEPFLRRDSTDHDRSEVALAVVESNALFAPVNEAFNALSASSRRLREGSASLFSDMITTLEGIFVPAVLGITLVVGVVGFWLIRSISGPLHRLNRTAQQLVDGDEVTFRPEHNDEIGALASILETMRLESASRYRTARTEAETAATFNQLGELTSFAQDEDTLVAAAVKVLQRVAPSPRGQVMLLNNSTNRLMIAASWGENLPSPGSAAAIDRTDRCPGIRRATAYVAEDLTDELSVRCPAHPAESGTVVCLPMPALGSIVGVIHLERPEAGGFEPETVQRASRTAEQVALAIANARLMLTMEGLANTDPLTGLRNGRFFDAYLEEQFVLAERDHDSIGLIMLDLDHFKEFNDTYGHPAGDEALRSLSRTMRSVLRTSDVIARYGGEEFIVALHHTELTDARIAAEKLRAAIEETVVEIGPGRYARYTASLGVVATNAHRVDRKGLVALADAAMYRAKSEGRNRVETAPTSAVELGKAVRRRAGDASDGPLPFPVARATRGSKKGRAST